MSPARTAELFEMPFGMVTQVGPRNHVLYGGPNPPREMAISGGGKWWPIVKHRDTPPWAVQKQLNAYVRGIYKQNSLGLSNTHV